MNNLTKEEIAELLALEKIETEETYDDKHVHNHEITLGDADD